VKANSTTTLTPLPVGEGRTRRRAVRGVAAAVVGLLALSACTSDPGPKRVAEDIIKAESFINPDLDEECLLDELDNYSNDDLETIAAGLDRDGSTDQTEAEAALAEFQASLESCLT